LVTVCTTEGRQPYSLGGKKWKAGNHSTDENRKSRPWTTEYGKQVRNMPSWQEILQIVHTGLA